MDVENGILVTALGEQQTKARTIDISTLGEDELLNMVQGRVTSMNNLRQQHQKHPYGGEGGTRENVHAGDTGEKDKGTLKPPRTGLFRRRHHADVRDHVRRDEYTVTVLVPFAGGNTDSIKLANLRRRYGGTRAARVPWPRLTSR